MKLKAKNMFRLFCIAFLFTGCARIQIPVKRNDTTKKNLNVKIKFNDLSEIKDIEDAEIDNFLNFSIKTNYSYEKMTKLAKQIFSELAEEKIMEIVKTAWKNRHLVQKGAVQNRGISFCRFSIIGKNDKVIAKNKKIKPGETWMQLLMFKDGKISNNGNGKISEFVLKVDSLKTGNSFVTKYNKKILREKRYYVNSFYKKFTITNPPKKGDLRIGRGAIARNLNWYQTISSK